MRDGDEPSATIDFRDVIGEVLPDVAVFGDPMADRHVERRIPIDAAALRSALAGLDGFATMRKRVDSATRLHAVAAAQAEYLRGELGGERALPEVRSAAQAYFRIRTGSHSADETLWYCLRVVADTAGDLIDAPICGSDVTRIACAMATVLDGIPAPGHAGSRDLPAAAPPRSWSAEEMWLRRWILGHQLHAMLNVHAAHELAGAAEALLAGRYDAATYSIETATRIVEGFSGARALAMAVPAGFYNDVLRPTMLPPLTPVPLTGRMHVEYRGYRRRLEGVLSLLPYSYAQLATARPKLAFALERLLEADLVEAERHVTLAEPLVGDSKSLIQTGKSAENAVSALRRIRRHRAAEVANHVRFPDC